MPLNIFRGAAIRSTFLSITGMPPLFPGESGQLLTRLSYLLKLFVHPLQIPLIKSVFVLLMIAPNALFSDL